MAWILIVIIAHFFYAGIFIIDRYLLKKGFPHPLSYAFWVGILSIFILLLVPFGFSIPEINQMIVSLIAGVVWLFALIIFYTALYKGEASRVVPTVGGLIPVFTLILSFIFLGERLSLKQVIAFCLLVSGGVILSLLVTKFSLVSQKVRPIKAFFPGIAAALVYAVYFIMTKSVFLNLGFINGIIWIRLGATLGASFLLIPSSFRRIIFKKKKIVKSKSLGLFLSARGLGILAGFLIYLAIYLGSVTLVNALQGTQYLFLLLLAFLFFRKIPSLREHFEKRTLAQKVIAIILIAVGLIVLII